MAQWMASGTPWTPSPWVSVALHSKDDAVLIAVLRAYGVVIYGQGV